MGFATLRYFYGDACMHKDVMAPKGGVVILVIIALAMATTSSKVQAQDPQGRVSMKNNEEVDVVVKGCSGPIEAFLPETTFTPGLTYTSNFRLGSVRQALTCSFYQASLVGPYTATMDVFPKTDECTFCDWEIRRTGFYLKDSAMKYNLKAPWSPPA